MKSLLFTFLIFVSVAAHKCKQQRLDTIPACVQQRIDSIRAQPLWNPPAEVNEYTYNGRRVFLFSAPCCDQFSAVYDEACNYVCAPSGGLTGKGDRKCADFADVAKHIRLVWKDERVNGE